MPGLLRNAGLYIPAAAPPAGISVVGTPAYAQDGTAGTTTSLSTSYNLGASANFLVVVCPFRNAGTNNANLSATWNSVAMVRALNTGDLGSTNPNVAIFILGAAADAGGAAPATGTNTLVVTGAGSGWSSLSAHIIGLSGASLSDALGAAEGFVQGTSAASPATDQITPTVAGSILIGGAVRDTFQGTLGAVWSADDADVVEATDGGDESNSEANGSMAFSGYILHGQTSGFVAETFSRAFTNANKRWAIGCVEIKPA